MPAKKRKAQQDEKEAVANGTSDGTAAAAASSSDASSTATSTPSPKKAKKAKQSPQAKSIPKYRRWVLVDKEKYFIDDGDKFSTKRKNKDVTVEFANGKQATEDNHILVTAKKDAVLRSYNSSTAMHVGSVAFKGSAESLSKLPKGFLDSKNRGMGGGGKDTVEVVVGAKGVRFADANEWNPELNVKDFSSAAFKFFGKSNETRVKVQFVN